MGGDGDLCICMNGPASISTTKDLSYMTMGLSQITMVNMASSTKNFVMFRLELSGRKDLCRKASSISCDLPSLEEATTEPFGVGVQQTYFDNRQQRSLSWEVSNKTSDETSTRIRTAKSLQLSSEGMTSLFCSLAY